MPDYSDITAGGDVNEIKFNLAEGESDVEVTKTKRHKLKAFDRKSRSTHSFKNLDSDIDNNENIAAVSQQAVATPIIAEPEPIVYQAPVINTPPEPPVQEPVKEPVEEAVVNEAPVRRAKASSSTKEEIENSSESLRASIEADKKKTNKPYKYPPLTLLNDAKKGSGDSKEYLQEMAGKLQRTLGNFGVQANVTEVTLGPSVTRYELEIAEGTRVSKVVNLSDDIKLNMAVTDVRIEAPIPGKSAIGIEVPNKVKSMVGFKELVASKEFKNAKSKII